MLNKISILDMNIYNAFFNSGDIKTEKIMRRLTWFGEPIVAIVIGIVLFIAILVYIKSKENDISNNTLKIKDVFGNDISIKDNNNAIVDGVFGEKKITIEKIIKENITFVLLTVMTTQIMTYLLKIIIRRQRPEENILKNAPYGYSFPSGHTSIISTYCALLSYYISNSKLNTMLKATLIVILFLFSIFVGLSRMYLGAHYMFDVIIGLIIGWGIPLIFMSIFDKKKRD